MAKVRTMVRSTLMPISAAVSWSSHTARIARPVRVRLMKTRAPSISAMALKMTISCVDAKRMPARSKIAVEEVEVRIGAHAGAEQAAGGVLEEQRGADGGDERHEAGRAAQLPVGDPLEQHRDDHADEHRHGEDDGEGEDGVAVHEPASARPVAAK